jgi:hypothetical protein
MITCVPSIAPPQILTPPPVALTVVAAACVPPRTWPLTGWVPEPQPAMPIAVAAMMTAAAALILKVPSLPTNAG